MNSKTKNIVLSGLFIALGILLPIFFHAVGFGPIFLPMHIPVLLCGFFLPFQYAIIVGAATPLLSSLITGMPPIFPIMPYMVFELAVYAALTSILYRKYKLNTYVSLIVSMISGRIVAGFCVWFLVTFFTAKLPGPFIFIYGALIKGIPGIVIQLLFIPTIVILINKQYLIKGEKHA